MTKKVLKGILVCLSNNSNSNEPHLSRYSLIQYYSAYKTNFYWLFQIIPCMINALSPHGKIIAELYLCIWLYKWIILVKLCKRGKMKQQYSAVNRPATVYEFTTVKCSHFTNHLGSMKNWQYITDRKLRTIWELFFSFQIHFGRWKNYVQRGQSWLCWRVQWNYFLKQKTNTFWNSL